MTETFIRVLVTTFSLSAFLIVSLLPDLSTQVPIVSTNQGPTERKDIGSKTSKLNSGETSIAQQADAVTKFLKIVETDARKFSDLNIGDEESIRTNHVFPQRQPSAFEIFENTTKSLEEPKNATSSELCACNSTASKNETSANSSDGKTKPNCSNPDNYPIGDLDREISSVLKALPGLIDTAVDSVEAATRFSLAKKISQGVNIVVASWLDTWSDMVINNRTLRDLGGSSNMYRYGFILFYGIGFGFPYLVNLPSPVLGCGSSDFVDIVEQYELTSGLGDLLSSLSTDNVKLVIDEFDQLTRARLNCVLAQEGSNSDAAEVVLALDQLRVLLDLRVDEAPKPASSC